MEKCSRSWRHHQLKWLFQHCHADSCLSKNIFFCSAFRQCKGPIWCLEDKSPNCYCVFKIMILEICFYFNMQIDVKRIVIVIIQTILLTKFLMHALSFFNDKHPLIGPNNFMPDKFSLNRLMNMCFGYRNSLCSRKLTPLIVFSIGLFVNNAQKSSSSHDSLAWEDSITISYYKRLSFGKVYFWCYQLCGRFLRKWMQKISRKVVTIQFNYLKVICVYFMVL